MKVFARDGYESGGGGALPRTFWSEGALRDALAARGYAIDVWRCGRMSEVHVYTAKGEKTDVYVLGFNPEIFDFEDVLALLRAARGRRT